MCERVTPLTRRFVQWLTFWDDDDVDEATGVWHRVLWFVWTVAVVIATDVWGWRTVGVVLIALVVLSNAATFIRTRLRERRE